MGLILVNTEERKATFYKCMSDVASELNLNRSTIYRWAKSGVPMKVMYGYELYFDCELVSSKLKKGGKFKKL